MMGSPHDLSWLAVARAPSCGGCHGRKCGAGDGGSGADGREAGDGGAVSMAMLSAGAAGSAAGEGDREGVSTLLTCRRAALFSFSFF